MIKKLPDIKWIHTEVDIVGLRPYEHNPRKISDADFKKLCSNIKRFGYHQRILATQDLRVIGGHQRIKALQECGYERIEILVANRELSDQEYHELMILDNIHNGDWEATILAEIFGIDQSIEWGVPEDVFANLDDGLSTEGLTDEDDVPEPGESPVTVPGDIWILGNHRLVCGDATSMDDADKLMGSRQADMLLTDPPYNVAYTGKTKDALTIQNDAMDDSSFKQFLLDAFTAADAFMKPGAVFYIWHADSEGYNFRGACHDIGWKVRQCLIWNKSTMVMGRQDYHWKHEPCLYGWKEGASHLWNSDRKQTTVIECDKPQRNAEHPTMKPVALMEYQIGNNTRKDNIVLDLFGGSGSTLIACEKLGRRACIMELDPIYCDVIIRRWQEFTGENAFLESDNTTFKEKLNERDRAAA